MASRHHNHRYSANYHKVPSHLTVVLIAAGSLVFHLYSAAWLSSVSKSLSASIREEDGQEGWRRLEAVKAVVSIGRLWSALSSVIAAAGLYGLHKEYLPPIRIFTINSFLSLGGELFLFLLVAFLTFSSDSASTFAGELCEAVSNSDLSTALPDIFGWNLESCEERYKFLALSVTGFFALVSLLRAFCTLRVLAYYTYLDKRRLRLALKINTRGEWGVTYGPTLGSGSRYTDLGNSPKRDSPSGTKHTNGPKVYLLPSPIDWKLAGWPSNKNDGQNNEVEMSGHLPLFALTSPSPTAHYGQNPIVFPPPPRPSTDASTTSSPTVTHPSSSSSTSGPSSPPVPGSSSSSSTFTRVNGGALSSPTKEQQTYLVYAPIRMTAEEAIQSGAKMVDFSNDNRNANGSRNRPRSRSYPHQNSGYADGHQHTNNRPPLSSCSSYNEQQALSTSATTGRNGNRGKDSTSSSSGTSSGATTNVNLQDSIKALLHGGATEGKSNSHYHHLHHHPPHEPVSAIVEEGRGSRDSESYASFAPSQLALGSSSSSSTSISPAALPTTSIPESLKSSIVSATAGLLGGGSDIGGSGPGTSALGKGKIA